MRGKWRVEGVICARNKHIIDFKIIEVIDNFNIKSMFNRQVATQTPNPTRTVGKFYQTQKISHHDIPNSTQPIQKRSRSKSVGRIYNTRYSSSKQQRVSVEKEKVSYENVINYKEVQNKLSCYLQCSMRTGGRQKYNYLSSQFNHKYDSIIKNYQPQYEPILLRDKKPLLDNQPISKTEQVSNLKQNVNQNNLLHRQLIPDQNKHPKYQSLPQKQQLPVSQQKLISQPQPLKQKTVQFQSEANYAVNIDKSDKKSLKNSRKESKENIVRSANKQNLGVGRSGKKEGSGIVGLNHQQHKNQLQNKLKRMITNYEIKNKQLENELKKVEAKNAIAPQVNKKEPTIELAKDNSPPSFTQDQLKQVLTKLIDFNLKGINLSKDTDEKLQEIWKSIHQQIIVDQQMRIIKCFINEANLNTVSNTINQNRIKKIDLALLKTHPDEYDPFLIQKYHELLGTKYPDLTHKTICKWLADNIAKFYQIAQKNWLKNLSQEKMQCTIRTMSLEKDITSLRKMDAQNKELHIRDFTRYLSTLFKANLRNRNVFQIYNKLKGMSYSARFIVLLEEKAGKGADLRKQASLPK